MNRLSITDKDLWAKSEAYIEVSEPFDVAVDKGHRHFGSFQRMLEAIQGYPDKRGAWRKFWDALRSADLLGVWGEAVKQHDYEWSWRREQSGLVVSFQPGSRWRRREDHGLVDRIYPGRSAAVRSSGDAKERRPKR